MQMTGIRARLTSWLGLLRYIGDICRVSCVLRPPARCVLFGNDPIPAAQLAFTSSGDGLRPAVSPTARGSRTSAARLAGPRGRAWLPLTAVRPCARVWLNYAVERRQSR